jgi:hypothetical protein
VKLPEITEIEFEQVPSLNVDLLEAAMLQSDLIIEIKTVHRFAKGVYAREVTIPAGTLLTGRIHKTQHVSIISKGRITVWSAGNPAVEICAPFTFVAEPGTRRVGYAHEETVWTTIHPTNETDLDKLEAEFIEPHENPYVLSSPEEDKCLG